jgi:hypothetical protein
MEVYLMAENDKKDSQKANEMPIVFNWFSRYEDQSKNADSTKNGKETKILDNEVTTPQFDNRPLHQRNRKPKL